jgi:hypothetical protein
VRTGRLHAKLRPRLSYASVVSTIAIVIAVGGGTVYAAAQLGKNDVRSRNLAPGAVKASDLGKNAVTSPKVRNRTVRAADIAAGVIRHDFPDVTGSATGGPAPVPNTDIPVPVALSGTTSFTPQAGQVSALVMEAQFTYASANGVNPCRPAAVLFVNGQATRVFAGAPSTQSTTPVTGSGYDADGPFGLVNPGTTLNVAAAVLGQGCTAETQVDRIEVRIVQID